MATLLLRVAGAGVGCALALGMSLARAADPPHASRAPKTTGAKTAAKVSALRVGRATDAGARRSIAGEGSTDDAFLGVEAPELRALREAERELFPPASPALPGDASADLPAGLREEAGPQVHASGVPPSGLPPSPLARPGVDSAGPGTFPLEMPDLPVRWDERVVRYVEFFRDDARGRTAFANLFRRSGRWREMMRRALQRKSLPEDLVWLSMIESGFDPTARSGGGAAGLWQFMPETAKIYGLSIDHWVDERLSPQLSTDAAAEFLADLHRRFGSWDLALAGYNMGYAGLASVVRRYNTNDFWSLAHTEGTLPWETTLYVPKVLAAAVVAHNLAAFGFDDLTVELPVSTDEVNVPPGTPLLQVAQAAGCAPKELEALNPELRAGRTPPAAASNAPYPVKVARGKGPSTALTLAKLRRDEAPLERHLVRFGETLEQIAALHKTTAQKLIELNAIESGEKLRGGTVLLVPTLQAVPAAAPLPANGKSPISGPSKPSVVVPSDEFVYPDRKRVFYRVLVGDRLVEIAAALQVSLDELRRWNDLDPAARLQEGMTLQAFVPLDFDLSRVVVLTENEVRVLVLGTEEFFAALEHEKAFRRVLVAAKAGDTLEAIGKRFEVTPRTMERINRRGRRDVLNIGETVVVYVPTRNPPSATAAATATNGPVAVGFHDGGPPRPLPQPPIPDLLP